MLPGHSPEIDEVFFYPVSVIRNVTVVEPPVGGKTAPTRPQSAPGGLFSGRAWLPSWAVGACPVQRRMCNFPLQPAR